MEKGKSINTSVPSIAIRFNANDEEIEQLYLSDSEVDREISTPIIDEIKTTAANEKKDSPKRESSPMKDVFSKLSKRSASIDSNITSLNAEQSPSNTDRWRLFSEIKGKLTKTVEEKISEMKSGSSKCAEDAETIRHKFGSKDNSSVSDSEDVSVSENSASKFADVEMSSNEEEIEICTVQKENTCDEQVDDQLFNDEIVIKMGRSRGNSTGSSSLRQRFKKTLFTSNVTFKNKEVLSVTDSMVETATEAIEDNTAEKENDEEDSVQLPEVVKKTKIEVVPKWCKICFFIAILSITFSMMSLPNYLVGILTGLCVVLFKKYFSNNYDDNKQLTFMIRKMETLNREHLAPVKTYEPNGKHEVWMNEYPGKYAVHTYHIRNTQSVYVQLEGSNLTLSTGQTVRVSKRAMWNEPSTKLHLCKFSRHRDFSMIGAKVKLLPDGLARKRYWSKKYPICIEFAKMGKEYTKLTAEEESNEENLNNSTPCTPVKNKSLVEENNENSELSSKDNKNSSDQQPNQADNDNSMSTLNDEQDLDLDDIDETSVEWDTVEDVLDGITRLYLFTRTDRDKEEWYNLFVIATHCDNAEDTQDKESLNSMEDTSPKPSPSHSSSKEKDKDKHEEVVTNHIQENYLLDYKKFAKKMQRNKKTDDLEQSVNEFSSKVLWVNALVGRVLFDAVRQSIWVESLQQRIQRKLSVIKLPYFIQELVMTELDLGTSIPIIHKISEPTFDARGVWVDIDITYDGSLHGTLETKLNLMKLKKPPVTVGQEVDAEKSAEILSGPVYDSDLDDSAESSSEEDSTIPANWLTNNNLSSQNKSDAIPPGPPNTTGRKLLKMVDKIAASKYFQQATDYKLIKKAMENVSRTELKLRVELKGLVGVLTVNIPPPPTHRIWIGFRNNPQLWLNAKPIVGELSLNFNHITSWIENKLQQEFQKVLVLPNMEDFVIPLMNFNLPE